MTDLATAVAPSAAEALEQLTRSGGEGVLRFLTCGSVDDGKSTLIGRLLYDSKRLFDDQIDALAKDSEKHGTTGEELDFALLLDGLEAEREQGITIDVAYRFFSTEKRKFVVADTPGHEQYTRNMATGASTAQVAVMMVDARKGILTQTKRHTTIAHLLGIQHIVVAINKMDLVEHSSARYHQVAADYLTIAEQLGFASITPIPMSARYGDNVTTRSENMPWYTGPTLLEFLEGVDISGRRDAGPFRLPVQWVNRPNLDFRGFSGTVVSGHVEQGADVIVAASGKRSKVKRIVTADGDLPKANPGDAITLVLEDEIDIARGDVIVTPTERPEVASQFAAHVIWMDEEPMIPGRPYLLKIGAATVPGTVTLLKHKVDVNTMEERPGRTLELNEIALCNFDTSRSVAFDPYNVNRDTGGFIIIDRFTNQTVGAGMVDFSLRRASNIHWQELQVDKAQRAAMKEQAPAVLWFTGLSGSGKSTVSALVERKLATMTRHTYVLDGDNVRHGLNRDLGFTDADRVENIRRIGEVSKLFVDAGLIVLTSFISPFRAERSMVREMLGEGEFIEIFVDAPIELCMERDPKGLYKKAQAGEIKNFTGFDSPYEAPENPELVLKSAEHTPDELAEQVIEFLRERGMVKD